MQLSTRPGRRSQARIVGKSPKVDIDQSAFVIHGEGIPSDYRIWRAARYSVLGQLPAPSPAERNWLQVWNRCQSHSPEGLSNGCSNEPD